jgi:Reverse transcriptase (RNA-dependent DNA polymerase)/Endonuclease-reverse transcriptase
MKVLQVNVDRGGAAQELLEHTVLSMRVDVAIMAEPNKKMTQVRERGWVMDESEDVAVRVFGNGRKWRVDEVKKGKGIVAVRCGRVGFCGVYVSPNIDREGFKEVIRGWELLLRGWLGRVIVAGDVNSKSREWGSAKTDWRGEEIVELASSLGLHIVNEGNAPTFQRGSQCSVIDVTMVSECLVKDVREWKVCECETLSTHRYIMMDLEVEGIRESAVKEERKGWRMDEEGMKVLPERLEQAVWNAGDDGICGPKELEGLISEVCDDTFKKKGRGGRFLEGKYWWNEEIARERKECVKLRRVMSRMYGKKVQGEGSRSEWNRECERARGEYEAKRKAVRKMIRAAKERAWKVLVNELEEDVWGRAYRIVMGKIGGSDVCMLNQEDKVRIACELFPRHPRVRWRRETGPMEGGEPFTPEELTAAAARAKNRKAPGPDGIPNEVMKMTVRVMPEKVLKVMNGCLRECVFPREWKEARLVLIPKPPKPGVVEVKYRPVCLLNTLGKLYERMVCERMNEWLDVKGLLSANQHGFRRGKSTMSAVEQILNIVDKIRNKSYAHRNFCVLVTLDVKNAFNNLAWVKVVETMQELEAPQYLTELVKSYFSNRTLLVGEEIMHLSSGVPQGSVMGPLLWNIFYDGVLRLPLPEGAITVGYADDLALVITARDERRLREVACVAIGLIEEWMEKSGMVLAVEKTEGLILYGGRRLRMFDVTVGGYRIECKPELEYLGVWLDRGVRMNVHVRKVADKAERMVKKMIRLMPSGGGPGSQKRRVYVEVVHSVLLYGAPIWGPRLKSEGYLNILRRVQRRAVLRMVAAYRTVSTEALLVVAGVPPLSELVGKRRRAFEGSELNVEGERRRMFDAWQEKWDAVRVGRWTYGLIGRVDEWVKWGCVGLNHYVVQFLTGHGCFGAYLFRIGRRSSADCVYCGAGEDGPGHIMVCERWEREMVQMSLELGERLCVENFGRMIVEGKWDVMNKWLTEVMRMKVREEDVVYEQWERNRE